MSDPSPIPTPLPSDGSIRTLLSREESYAIHALVNIGENPGTNAAALAAQLELPKAFTAKVLRKLVEAGWVESRMGRAGGVWLVADPSEVSLLDVMEAMSGPVVLDTCQAKVRCVTQRRKGRCALNRAYLRALGAIRHELSAIRLDDLADPPRDA